MIKIPGYNFREKYIYQTTDKRLFDRDPLLDNLLDIIYFYRSRAL